MILRYPYFAPFITDATASTVNTSHSCPQWDGPFIMKIEARSNSLSGARSSVSSPVKKSPHWFLVVLQVRMSAFGSSFS